MSTQVKQINAEDLLTMLDDGFRYELVRGKLRRMPLAGAEHGVVAGNVGFSLGRHAEDKRLGHVYATGTGFLLSRDPDTVLAPDAAFVRRERLVPAGELDGYWPGAPDLAAEVVSPGDTYSQVVGRALDWLETGCRMVLVADPRNPERRTVTVYRSLESIRILIEGDVLNGADIVPGWSLSVAGVFAW